MLSFDDLPDDKDKSLSFDDLPSERTLPQEIARQAGLGGRMLVKGALSLPAVFANPLAVTLNALTGSRRFATDQAEGIANALPLPTPETPAERIAGFGGEAGAGGGISSLLAKPIAALPGVPAAVKSFLGDAPAAQIFAPAAGGMVQQGAQEAGMSPGASTGLGLATSLLTGVPIAAREMSGLPVVSNPWAPKQLSPKEAAFLGVQDAAPVTPVTKMPVEAPAPTVPAADIDPASLVKPNDGTVSFLGMGKVPQLIGELKTVYADKVGDPAWKWISDIGSGQTHTVPVDTKLGTAMRWFIDSYGQPKEYVQMKQARGTMRNAINNRMVPVVEKISAMSPEDNKVFYRMLQGEEVTPVELSGLKAETREVIDDVGNMMVDVGLLSKETYEKNLGTYLHREYTSKRPESTWFGRNVRMVGNELKARGRFAEFPVEKVPELQAQGWEVFGKPKGDTVKMRIQLTREQRDQLGEVDDAAYAVAKTMLAMSNDVATYKFYDDIAKTYGKDVEMPGYTQITSDKIPKTARFKYGNLAGKWVPDEIAADFSRINTLNQIRSAPLIKQLIGAQSLWKLSKTALSPVAHFNNTSSNVSLYYLADADWKYLKDGAKAAMEGPKSPLYQIAERYGVLDSQMATQELSKFARNRLEDLAQLKGEPDNLLKLAVDLAKKPVKGAIDLYQGEDAAFRLGVLLDRLAKGKPIEEAAADARKIFVDYNIDAPAIQVMRDTTHPFLAYPYRMVPILMETAIKRPWKFAVLGGIWKGMQEVGEKYGGGDAEAERASMPENLNQKMFGAPFMPRTNVKLPAQTEDGRSIYLNTYRNLPGGDIFEAGTGAFGTIPGVPMPLQPSGGLWGAIAAAGRGQDQMSGKPLPGLGFGTGSDLAIRGESLARSLIPNIPGMPGSFATKKIQQSMSGHATPLGDVQPTWMSVLQGFGPKVNIVDPEKNETRAKFDIQQHYRTASQKIREAHTAYMKGQISKEQFEEQKEEWQNKAREYRDEVMKRISSGKSKPTVILQEQ